MELDFLHAPELAANLVGAYGAASGDADLAPLVPFYATHRAFVRGKVESLKSREPEVDAPERESARARAGRYFRLARRYTRPPAGSAIVVVCGLSATGKSTVAGIVEDLTGFTILSSDAVRKEMAGVAPTARHAGGYREGLYAPEMTRRTYEALAERAGRVLAAGRGVVLDATFQTRWARRLVVDLAERLASPVVFVECRAHEREIERRMAERHRRPDEVSDATSEVYRRQLADSEPIDELHSDAHVVLDTSRSGEALVDAVEGALERFF
jgi:hypothetical protein